MAFTDLDEGILELFGEAQGSCPPPILEYKRGGMAITFPGGQHHLRKFLKECTRCGTPCEETTCRPCLDKMNVAARTAQHNNVANGLCWCGRAREDAKFKCCERCREKSRENRALKGDQRRPKAPGTCRRCDAPRAEGKSCCAACLAKGAAYMAKKRANALRSS